MSKVGLPERVTQNRLVKLFQNELGYTYLGDWKDRAGNSNVEAEYLRAFLQDQGIDEALITKAINAFVREAGNQTDSLYDVNKRVYGLLRYGVKVKPKASEHTDTVSLIDWKHIERNHFALAEEVTVPGENTKRPDLVLYVNGIALGVIELKRSKVNVSEGIRQNLDNQTSRFIRRFFNTAQLVMAGNDTQGVRYGTVETPEKHYLKWKEDSGIAFEHLLDKQIVQMCHPHRLLELIHDFIIFDAGIKKVCRPNQYFGVKAAQARIKEREGGIIWHTQGSGKSLTMVWLTKWIREHYHDARVLVITDRAELDEQIEGIYYGVDEKIYRTKSAADLIANLAATKPLLMCSLIHKFPGQEEGNVDAFMREIRTSIPADFRAFGDFYVFVDECHRTQSGKLNRGMQELLPTAIFIGFTGTPLLKVDKKSKTSLETFGTYIHTYKYDEAVKDEVVLDLRYEARDIDQHLESPEEVDQWFQAKTAGLTDIAVAQLKQRWGTMRNVLSSRPRLDRIVNDIIFDMDMRPRLMDGRGNALLVAGSIYEACKLYELFIARGFDKCAIITSYDPSPSNIKGETTGDGDTEELEKYEAYQKMLERYGEKNVEVFEQTVKKKFVHEPGQMKLLIVVDKLLTGFDAPSATYLYIDKQMRDHGLFQAICRVNRLDGDDKEYGYIIDYKDLFQNLEKSMHDYTSGAFDGYDREDVEGLLSDRLTKGRERLEQSLEAIRALCEVVPPPQDTPAYIAYFCGDTSDPEALKAREAQRLALYKHTTSLVRAYANIAGDMFAAGYSEQDIADIKREVDEFDSIRTEIKLASGDAIDLKMYEPGMRRLLDTYIQADKSRKVSAFDDLTLVELIVEQGVVGALGNLPPGLADNPEAVAETIENNVRRVIIDENPTNPTYYARMSELLDTLIQARKDRAIAYEQYLADIVELTKQVKNPVHNTNYPSSLTTTAKRALYDKLGDEELALKIDNAIVRTKKHGWRGDLAKEREIQEAIYEIVGDLERTADIFKLISNQRDY